MDKNDKVLIAGHRGMIGSAIQHRLRADGFKRLIMPEVDLSSQPHVSNLMKSERPDFVFLAVEKVGSITTNIRYSAELIYQNLLAQSNVIHSAWEAGVKKLIFLANSCVYPNDSPQPMKEEYLLTGRPESTSEPYAIAKIAGIKMCQVYNQQYGTCFIPVVPSDVYGPYDDFNPETGHVLPSLIAKMHEAKVNQRPETTVLGTGSPRREALYIEDLVDACIFLMNNYYDSAVINIGTGEDITVREMAQFVKAATGFQGDLTYDLSKPDGVPRKLLDNSRIKALGWTPRTKIEEGIKATYEWYLKNAINQPLSET